MKFLRTHLFLRAAALVCTSCLFLTLDLQAGRCNDPGQTKNKFSPKDIAGPKRFSKTNPYYWFPTQLPESFKLDAKVLKRELKAKTSDAKNSGTVVIIDPRSSGDMLPAMFLKLGYKTIAIHTELSFDKLLGPIPLAGIDEHLYFYGKKTADEIQALTYLISKVNRVAAVVAPFEPSVLLGSQFQKAFQNYFPAIAYSGYSVGWRDKSEMGKILKAHGLRHFPEEAFDTWEAAKNWILDNQMMNRTGDLIQTPLLTLKMLSGAAGHGVEFAWTIQEAEQIFRRFLKSRDLFSNSNSKVLIQKYLHLPEYVVNLVRSVDPATGKKVTICTDIWIYLKQVLPDGKKVYDVDILVPYDETQHRALFDAAVHAADALDLQTGFAHVEMFKHADGKLDVIDFGARMAGSHKARSVFSGTGLSQAEAGVLAYLDFDKFKNLPQTYAVRRLVRVVHLISRSAGIFSSSPLEQLLQLKLISTYDHHYLRADGSRVKKTEDLLTSPGIIALAIDAHNPNAQAILDQDVEAIKAQNWVTPK